MSQALGPPRNREAAAESFLIMFEHFPLSFVCSGVLDDAFRRLDHEPRWLKRVLNGPRNRVTSVTDLAPVTSVNRPQRSIVHQTAPQDRKGFGDIMAGFRLFRHIPTR